MKRIGMMLMVLAMAGGCRTAHLGPDTGDDYRAAMAAQRDSKAEAPPMSAGDAKNTMARHRGEKASSKGSASGAAAAGVTSVSSSVSGGGGGSWPGASGSIRLDAK